MPTAYSDVLPRAQKLFTLRSIARNALATAHYHTLEKPLPPSEKLTLFTCNIFPPNVVVWHHLVRKYFGDRVETFIFDCSGDLDPKLVPGAKVHKYFNAMHPTKIDVFLRRSARHRKCIWICDDDIFPISDRALDVLSQEFAVPNTATVSLHPRNWWHFAIKGKEYEASGSYCVVLDRDIFVEKEHLNAQSADGNVHPAHNGKGCRRYDTLDKANETLLMRGYRCAVVGKEKRDACMRGFDGTSGGALLLWYLGSKEKVLRFFNEPKDEQWGGNLLFGLLNSLFAIHEIQKIYAHITGSPYPLPALPKMADLEQIRKRTEPHLAHGRSYGEVEETGKSIAASL
ncbi:MAG: hypothetical protein PHO92_00435 [Candidatus Peribacteraceae bacterium]|nr:hypothetical protein [Candidatus Peribacteraceae bacterium]